MIKPILTLVLILTMVAQVLAQEPMPKSKKKSTKIDNKSKHVIPVVYIDSIILSNGDAIVGEIKSMDQSVLTMKTKYSKSDFKIKWHKVLEIYSNRLFIVSGSDGERRQGFINTDPKNKEYVILDIGEHSQNIKIRDIVFIIQGGQNFFSRLKAEFDVGVTLTKANNLRQFTANASSSYVADRSFFTGSFGLVRSSQDSIANIRRLDGDLMYQRYLHHDWFLQGQANFLSNSEQLLQLRTTIRTGAGYFFIKNNESYLGAFGGLALNNETYTEETDPTKQSMEIYVGGEFNKYDIGDLSLKSSIVVSPSVTESGRIRTDIKFDMKYDLPLDFYVKMSATYNYDNQPAEGASKDDYVFQTSFGWELK